MTTCGPPLHLVDDDGDGTCCIGASCGGPDRCTCWERIYDVEQENPRVAGPVVTRDEMCHDCAFRAGSPEMSDESRRDDLLSLVDGDKPFWCHQGPMRRLVGWKHPDGRTVILPDHHYAPLKVDGEPLKADGTRADICAGWARAHAARVAEESK